MKKIQFYVDSGDKRRNRKIMLEILSIKKKNSSFEKEVHLYECNGYLHTSERFWKRLKKQYGSDLCFVGEIDL